MVDPRTETGFRQQVQQERYYILRQPVVSLTDMTHHHDEWLVRFEGEDGLEHMIRPAEISGAITALDLTMLEQAIRTLNADKRRKPIAVNLSGASVGSAGFESAFFEALSRLRTDRNRLIIELTESWDIRDLVTADRFLQGLRDLGHPICIDDVGAGAASIRYIRAFETEWLKIDGEFVQAAKAHERDRVILKSLLSLKEGLSVKFIAEGLEDQETIDFAISLGFDAGQGYALGKPEREPIRKRFSA